MAEGDAAGYASLILMAAKRSRGRVVTKRGVEVGERLLLPLLCARNINGNHFSPDTGAYPLCNTDRASGTVLLFIARFAPLDGTNKTS